MGDSRETLLLVEAERLATEAERMLQQLPLGARSGGWMADSKDIAANLIRGYLASGTEEGLANANEVLARISQRRFLTCWKEIAAYLGCGVRTAQRMERNIGLPVRRPNGSDYRIVLAFSDEVDAWRLSLTRVSPAETFLIFDCSLEEDIAKLKSMVRDRALNGNARAIVITFSDQPRAHKRLKSDIRSFPPHPKSAKAS